MLQALPTFNNNGRHCLNEEHLDIMLDNNDIIMIHRHFCAIIIIIIAKYNINSVSYSVG